jgi:hypothetical protein
LEVSKIILQSLAPSFLWSSSKYSSILKNWVLVKELNTKIYVWVCGWISDEVLQNFRCGNLQCTDRKG